ncbi:hypothetical protein FDECE_17454 [Fusarium decemcellulare]|nr:hypothetical protein FDECE_17454 [Fusarium decemcellulare]
MCEIRRNIYTCGRNEEQSITNFHQEVDKAADEAFQQKENATCHADKLSAGLEDLRRLVKDRGDALPASLRDVVSETEGNFHNATLAVEKAEEACKEGTEKLEHLNSSRRQSYSMEREFSGQKSLSFHDTIQQTLFLLAQQESDAPSDFTPQEQLSAHPEQDTLKSHFHMVTAQHTKPIFASGDDLSWVDGCPKVFECGYQEPRPSHRPSQIEVSLPARKWKQGDAVEAMMAFRAACDERTEAEQYAARLRTEYTGADDFLKHWIRLCADLLSYGEEEQGMLRELGQRKRSPVALPNVVWLAATRQVSPDSTELSDTLDHVFCKARDIIGNDDGIHAASNERLAENAANRTKLRFLEIIRGDDR